MGDQGEIAVATATPAEWDVDVYGIKVTVRKVRLHFDGTIRRRLKFRGRPKATYRIRYA